MQKQASIGMALLALGCAPGTPTAGGPSPGASAGASPAASAAPSTPSLGAPRFVVDGVPVPVEGQVAIDHFKATEFTFVFGQLGGNINSEARLLLQLRPDAEKGKSGAFGAGDLYAVAALFTHAKRGIFSQDWSRDQNKGNQPNPVTLTVADGKVTMTYKATIPKSGSPSESVTVEASATDAKYNKKF